MLTFHSLSGISMPIDGLHPRAPVAEGDFAMFNDEKAAQIAAYFLSKSGGKMPHLKLMKLMYLADRESLGRHGHPISFDRLIAMGKGPALSQTLDLIHDEIESFNWSNWIGDCENHTVALVKSCDDREDFDELSNADLRVIDDVWIDFGHLTKWEIVDYTHEHCAEWKDPGNSSHTIEASEVFEALGSSPKVASRMHEVLKQQVHLNRKLAALK